jgi:hypothetical protein
MRLQTCSKLRGRAARKKAFSLANASSIGLKSGLYRAARPAGELDPDFDTTSVRYGPRRPVPPKLDAYTVTSQFAFAGLAPSGKLSIPLNRRDVRLVEGARLEIGPARAC